MVVSSLYTKIIQEHGSYVGQIEIQLLHFEVGKD